MAAPSRALPRLAVPFAALALLAGTLAPPQAPARAQAGDDPRAFTQTGFRVVDDGFWGYFQQHGGVSTFGYPVSRAFTFLGCTTQFFQRLVVQRCAGGPVQLLNLLDPDLFPYTQVNGSVFPAPDATLKDGTPKVEDPGYAGEITAFIQSTVPDSWEDLPVGFLSTFGATGGLEIWGAPISLPARDPSNPSFVYMRFQRGIMHFDGSTGVTQGLLLADYLKAVLTGQNLPDDLAAQAQSSPLYLSAAGGTVPPATSFVDAFAPDAGPLTAAAAPPPAPAPPPPPPVPTAPDSAPPVEGQPRSGFPYGVLAANIGDAPLAHDTGFRVLATTFSWPRTSPGRGRYLFEEKDQWGNTAPNDLTNILNAASSNGMKAGLRLFGVPDWAGGTLKNVNPSDLEDFVYHAVKYAGSRAAFVEVFNEENLPYEWGGSPDPGGYARLLAGAYRGAKRANPSIPVISAGPSQRTGGLGGTMEDVDWLEGFYQAGGQQSADAIGVHAYLGNFDPATPYSCRPLCFRQVEEFRGVMQRHGDSRPMYITEMGTLEQTTVDLGAFNWFKLPSDQRASFLVRALRMANATYPWIAGANVFNLDHSASGYPSTDPQAWFSLLSSNKSPRQAYNAIRQARSDGTLP